MRLFHQKMTKSGILWLLCCLFFFNNSAFSAEKMAVEIKKISVVKAKQLHDQGAVFIDARSWLERKFGTIENSIAISKNDVDEKAPTLVKNKDQPIVTYCAVGVRASVAAQNLHKLGYTNVHVVTDAGFSDWKKAGYPLEKSK